MLDTISYTILFCYCSDPKRRTSWYLSRKGFEGLKNLLKSNKGNRAVCRIGISSHTCTLTKPCPRTCCAMWLPQPVSLSDRPWLGSPTGSPSLGVAPSARKLPPASSLSHPALSGWLLPGSPSHFLRKPPWLAPLWVGGPHLCAPSISPIVGNGGHAIDAVHMFALLSRLQRTYGLFDALSLKAV